MNRVASVERTESPIRQLNTSSGVLNELPPSKSIVAIERRVITRDSPVRERMREYSPLRQSPERPGFTLVKIEDQREPSYNRLVSQERPVSSPLRRKSPSKSRSPPREIMSSVYNGTGSMNLSNQAYHVGEGLSSENKIPESFYEN